MAIVTQRVLVVKTSSLGDIVHGLQFAQTLKENDPGIEITWVVRSRFEPLVRASSAVDRTITFYRSGGISGFASLCGRLRKRHFDMVLDLQGLARSGLMTFFSKAPRKIGRADAREGARLFYKELVPLPRPNGHVHPVDILLEFCRVFGFETKLKGTVRFTTKSSSAFGKSSRKADSVITIFPEGRSPRMSWQGFEELTVQILNQHPVVEVQVLATHSVDWANRLKADFRDRINVFRSNDPLKIAGCVQESALLIANDSDVTHIGAAVGVPTVALFGPTDGNKLGPYPLSEARNCAINASGGDLSTLTVRKVLEEVERRL